jgi:hypothetical protein
MQKADYLLQLMKQQTDALVAKDEKLQQFLMWVSEKSLSLELPYKPAAVRAFYFAVAVAREIAAALEIQNSPTPSKKQLKERDKAITNINFQSEAVAFCLENIPVPIEMDMTWIDQSIAQISSRNIGQDWHFSYQQMKELRQYYDANKLLVDCLNRAANVTPAVREKIEETLLLPIAEIQKRDSYQDK